MKVYTLNSWTVDSLRAFKIVIGSKEIILGALPPRSPKFLLKKFNNNLFKQIEKDL